MQAVLFDMDGVIYDSEPLHRKMFLETAAGLGCPVSEDYHRALTGCSADEQWRRTAERFGLDLDVQTVAARQMALFRERLPGSGVDSPMPGLVPVLSLLDNHGVLMGVGTSNERATAELVLRVLGISEYFSAVVTGEDVSGCKPAPDIFLEAARRLGVEPGLCLVVEDSANGVAAARAAGMKCVALRNPNSGDQDLSGADRIVESHAELQRLLAEPALL